MCFRDSDTGGERSLETHPQTSRRLQTSNIGGHDIAAWRAEINGCAVKANQSSHSNVFRKVEAHIYPDVEPNRGISCRHGGHACELCSIERKFLGELNRRHEALFNREQCRPTKHGDIKPVIDRRDPHDLDVNGCFTSSEALRRARHVLC